MTSKTSHPIVSFLIMIILITLDQATKKMADAYIQGKEMVHVLGDFIILVYAKNRGAFLSWGNEIPQTLWVIVFIVLPLAVLSFLTYYVFKKKWGDPLYRNSLILGLSGGLGNIIDRIAYGNVTDFMNIGIGPIFRSGIFNVADLYIVALVIYVLFHPKKK